MIMLKQKEQRGIHDPTTYPPGVFSIMPYPSGSLGRIDVTRNAEFYCPRREISPPLSGLPCTAVDWNSRFREDDSAGQDMYLDHSALARSWR